MTQRRGRLPAAAAATALIGGLLSAPGAGAAGPGDLPSTPAALAEAVGPVLRERAAAFLRRDAEAYTATDDGRADALVNRDRAAVAATEAVPFGSYTLEPDPEGVGDLARPRDRDRWGAATVVLPVREEYALRGLDPEPVAEILFLTLVRDQRGRWRVAADDALDDVGLQSARHPWDFGAVGVIRAPGVTVLHPSGAAAEAARVRDETVAALAVASAAWPLPWSRTVVVEVPRDVAALERRLQATFPLDDFAAFAAASSDEAGDRQVFTGSRVLVQPATFLRRSTGYRRRVLAHELIHVASRPASGPAVPAWLEEGVAQVYGENAARIDPAAVLADARAGRWAGLLPTDAQFVVGGGNRIRQSYAEAYLAALSLVRRLGRPGLARLYDAAGNDGRAAPGTARARLDTAFRAVLGQSLEAFEKSWAADVRAGRLR